MVDVIISQEHLSGPWPQSRRCPCRGDGRELPSGPQRPLAARDHRRDAVLQAGSTEVAPHMSNEVALEAWRGDCPQSKRIGRWREPSH